MKKIYIVDGVKYEIPDTERGAFLKDNPNAKAFYNVDGKEYHVPHQESDAFEVDMGLKKKDDTQLSPNGSTNTSSLTESNLKDGIPLVDIHSKDPVDNSIDGNMPGDENDIISNSIYATQLKNKTRKEERQRGTSAKYGTEEFDVPDEEAIKAGGELSDKLKAQGFDSKHISDMFSDIPDEAYNIPGFTKQELNARLRVSPLNTERYVGAFKWQQPMIEAINDAQKKDPNTDYTPFLNTIRNSASDVNYPDKRNDNKALVEMANRIPDADAREKVLHNLAIDRQFSYGQQANNPDNLTSNSPNFNQYMNAGYDYYKDIHPKEASQFDLALVDPAKIKDNPNAQIGLQEQQQKLEEVGINLAINHAKEIVETSTPRFNELAQKKESGTITPDEENELGELGLKIGKSQNDIAKAADAYNNFNQKYPTIASLNTNEFAQELIGQEHTLGHPIMTLGNAVDNTYAGIANFAKQPFQSDEQNRITQLEVLGQKRQQDNQAYLTQDNQLNETFEPKLSPALQAQVDGIKNNKLLSYGDKVRATSQLLKDSPGQWSRQPIEGGKTNVGLASMLYGVGDLAANLAPFMAAETLTGGGATAGAARKFASAFAATAATSYQETLANAIEKGESNPYAYAFRNTVINSLAMASAGTPDAIRELASTQKGAVKDLINGLTDSEISAAVKEGSKTFNTFQKVYNVGKNVVKGGGEGLKSGAKINTFTTGGQIVNDAISGELKAPQDYAKQALIETLKFGAFGAILGGGKKTERPSETTAATLLEVAKNPDAFTNALNERVSNGTISPKDAEQVKLNIDKAVKVVKDNPQINNLSDDAKREFVLNAITQNDVKEQTKSANPKQTEKLEHEALVAKEKNALITEPKPAKQLEKRKAQLEKAIIPEKDDNGKDIPVNETELKQSKAELEAINFVQEQRANDKSNNGEPKEVDVPIEKNNDVPETEKGTNTTVSKGTDGDGQIGTGNADAVVDEVNEPKSIKQLEIENKRTVPKVPSGNVFRNEVSNLTKEQKGNADDFIGTEKEKELPNESVSVNDIVPTQKNLTIPNLEKVSKIKEGDNIEDAVILIKKDGKYYVADGHHRIANEILKGNKSIEAKVYDADTNTTDAVGVEKKAVAENDFTKKSDKDIEDRMMDIDTNGGDFNEFNSLEKEMEKRERSTVFNVPLDKVNDAVDSLMKKDKEQPNGYGSFLDRRDARETKDVADKYLSPQDISDNELKQDFRDAVMGNPDTWYADGLKLRESLKEAANRGIDIKDLVATIEKEFIKDGYSVKDAHESVARRLHPILKDAETVNEKQLPENKSEKQKLLEKNVDKKEAEKPAISDAKTSQSINNEPPDKDSGTAEKGEEKDGGISKRALKKDYGFTKEFASVTDQQVADRVMDNLHANAKSNNIPVEQQAANEVARMKDKTGEATEHDILTAAFHLRNLDEQIANANSKGEDASHLLNQREEALATLRQLGNNAGRNLRLFGAVYKKAEGNRLEVVRAELIRDLNVPEIPQTMAALKASKLSDIDKKTVEPYVKAIEDLNKTLADIKTKVDKTTADVNSKEVQDYIEKEVAKRTADQKTGSTKSRQKKSKDLLDLAQRIRTENALEKFRKLGEQGGTPFAKSSIFGDVDFKELAAQAIEYIGKGLAKGEDLVRLVKEATAKFKDKFDETEFGKAIGTIVSKYSLPDKAEVIKKINEIAKNDGATSITLDMVKHGLINDVVNDHIHSDTPYDKVISEATKELQKHLPDVTESQVQDAILKKGEFKPETKQKLQSFAADKAADVKRLTATQKKVAALEFAADISKIKGDPTLTPKERKAAIEARKSDYEKELDKKLNDREQQRKDAAANTKKLKEEYKKLETERNRQLQKVADLTTKLEKLKRGERDIPKTATTKVDTPEIEALKKQVEVADKNLRDVENALKKAQRDAENEQKKLDDINEEIDHVRNTKTVFKKALKDPKEANEQLKAAKEQLQKEYAKAGLRKEPGNKNEIKIAQDAQSAIEEIKADKTLSDDTKKEHINAIETERDAALHNTRQGVLTNLKDAIDNHVAELGGRINDAIASGDKETADKLREVKKDLADLSDKLNPNTENLKDQIDKADQDLHAIIKSNEGTEFEQPLKDIQKEYHNDWQRTADEMQQQSLLAKAIASKKESERRIAAGQYTEIPTTPYDVQRDAALVKAEAESKRAWSQLNSLSIRAKEQRQKRGVIGTWLTARRQWLIMSPGALEKVGLSAITKPIIDPFLKQTFGRIAGAITGVKPTEFKRVFDTFRQMKNTATADKFMSKMNDAYVDAVVNHAKTVKEFGKESPQAEKSLAELNDAEINHQSALGYLFINANSAIDIAQVMAKGSTDLDAKMGKYAQSKYSERTKAQEVAFWIEGVNRTHSALKSVSYRQAVLDHYIENLQYIQKKEGTVSNEARQDAWSQAVLAGEEGRFGEATLLSRWVGRLKGSDNAAVRNTANWALPVAKISINITKQGADMAFPMVEAGWRTLKSGAVHGMKLNSAEGKEYSNFMSKYYDGVKRGFDELPYEQKKYINTLITRGLFGMAQYALVGYGLASGAIKYGGAYDPNDPFGKHKVMGSDGLPLKHGEWEFFGHRAPALLNVLINHSPYSLPGSIAAVSYEQFQAEDKKSPAMRRAITKTINEVYERLPFVTAADAFKAVFGGDDYKLQNIIANELPTMKATAEHFDKDADGNTRAVQIKGDGFMNTIKNIWESKVPGLRNTLPSKTGISDTGSPEYKYLSQKASGIVPYEKSSLKPIDARNKPIEVTDEKYKEFLSKREELIKKDISNLLQKGGAYKADPNLSDDDPNVVWETISPEEVKNMTADEVKSFLMTTTTRADAAAISEVFNGTQEPKKTQTRKVTTW